MVFWVSRMPTISISSPTLTMPRSTRPVTTVPRPEMVGVVDHVGFAQVDHHVGHADLTREQDVFAGLGHGAVGGGAD